MRMPLIINPTYVLPIGKNGICAKLGVFIFTAKCLKYMMFRKQFMTVAGCLRICVPWRMHKFCYNCISVMQFSGSSIFFLWSLSISASCKAQYCSHLKLQNGVTKTLMSHAFFVEFMRKGIYLKLFNLSRLNVQRVLILLYKVFVHWKLKLKFPGGFRLITLFREWY